MSNLTTVAANSIPPELSFSPFLPSINGKNAGRNPRIAHAFVKSLIIDRSNPPSHISLYGGERYLVIYNELVAEPNDPLNLPVIASFQKWDTGTYAILRKERTGSSGEQIVI